MHTEVSPKLLRVVSGQFLDFETFTQAAASWELEFVQLDRGDFRSDMLQASLGPVQLAYARFNRKLQLRGEPPVGLRTFTLLSESSSKWWWRGREASNNTITVYPVGGEIDAVIRPGYEGFAISVTADHLANVAREAGLPTPDDLIGTEEVFECDPAVVTALQLGLRAFGETVTRLPEVGQQELRRELEFELPTDLLRSIAGGRGGRDRSGLRFRSRAVQRVLNYIDAFPRQPHTVKDVCRVAGASERTIQTAFLERFGVRPKAYLRDRRLNGARADLCLADPATPITKVANRWGFWHMGQFARDYRRLFGKLPSETKLLRKRQRRGGRTP